MNRVFRSAFLIAFVAILFVPRPAAAQASDEWQVNFTPLYFWATELDGQMTAGANTVPIFLEFKDAADNLAGAFSFHLEAGKGRWGMFADLNYIKQSTDADFTVASRVVTGTIELKNTIFEAGGSYLVSPQSNFALIAGLRTYTLAPKITFTSSVTRAPFDESQTSANGFVGFTLRPKLTEKLMFVSRADIGAGNAEMTWSAEAGFDYSVKPWLGLGIGYKALGIDIGSDDAAEGVTEYDITHYGPIFGARFHWGR